MRKVEKIKNLAIFWWPLRRTHCLNITSCSKNFLEIWWLWQVFFPQNWLYKLHWMFFLSPPNDILVMTIVGWFSLFQRRNWWARAGYIYIYIYMDNPLASGSQKDQRSGFWPVNCGGSRNQRTGQRTSPELPAGSLLNLKILWNFSITQNPRLL